MAGAEREVAGRDHGARQVDSFDQLDMDPEIFVEYLDVIYDYLESASGERAVGLLKDSFPDEF